MLGGEQNMVLEELTNVQDDWSAGWMELRKDEGQRIKNIPF